MKRCSNYETLRSAEISKFFFFISRVSTVQRTRSYFGLGLLTFCFEPVRLSRWADAWCCESVRVVLCCTGLPCRIHTTCVVFGAAYLAGRVYSNLTLRCWFFSLGVSVNVNNRFDENSTVVFGLLRSRKNSVKFTVMTLSALLPEVTITCKNRAQIW